MDIPSNLGLEGKVAVICGGGAEGDGIGNGRATAILLAKAGAKVAIVDKNLESAQVTTDMIQDFGGTSCTIEADTTSESDCKMLAAFASKKYGRIDILDNNIGISHAASVVDETLEAWEDLMNTNVTNMFLTCKHVIPYMQETGGGSIINISSISALRPRGLTAYSASKGAVISLSRAMAIDHASDGIRVNCVAPGPVYTPMVYSEGMSEQAREQRRLSSPLAIEGSGWDIGQAVTFLASDWARYITGQVLVVDGGVTLTSKPRSYEANL